jgi:hypothetical protein
VERLHRNLLYRQLDHDLQQRQARPLRRDRLLRQDRPQRQERPLRQDRLLRQERQARQVHHGLRQGQDRQLRL